MNEPTDILTRLRRAENEWSWPYGELIGEAADEIERMKAQVQQLHDKMTCMEHLEAETHIFMHKPKDND